MYSTEHQSYTWFSCSSDKFGIFLELDIVITLVLHQHHLQIDVIANLEPPCTSISLLVQGHGRSHVAGEWTRTRTHTRPLERSKSNTDKVNYVCCLVPWARGAQSDLLLMCFVDEWHFPYIVTHTHTHTAHNFILTLAPAGVDTWGWGGSFSSSRSSSHPVGEKHRTHSTETQ